MKGNSVNLPITIALLMLSFMPWPGPSVFKISCPRDNARIVRKVVRTKWIPLLEKYKVKLPLECPFHPQRDIFYPQQAMKKQHRPSQWTCGICGKSFFEEKFLDMHFDNRHKGKINLAEDAVCLADYCDIMRCDVLSLIELKSETSKPENTDIEIWREASAYSKALAAQGPRDIAKYVLQNGHLGLQRSEKKCAIAGTLKCQKAEEKDAASIKGSTNDEDVFQQNFSSNNNQVCQSDLVDSALPAPDERQQRIDKIQKLKADCKPEELQKVKTKCEILVRDCIANLLIQLSVKDFREIEEELNRAVCWYLTCDRYWEDSQGDIKTFPWGILCMAFMLLSLGFCFCYYVVWVLFDISSTDDGSVTSASMTDRSTPSPAHALRPDGSTTIIDGVHVYSEDYIGSDKDSDYIYVTYPPDLKRRLLESCYNRTTRL
ncbi:uncharacterized protein LOC126745906 isoform X1 [Anthonomus grandis grandis]|uniref:uncharacterized protein LOC126745906 isoform X1 n=1 Tax=Anthonomus grandis grandis TaxID=2921223 RepID=UPI002166540B|nr:uncharacterized protein LOC126745906 isoform X1 [Anthonomus grandis grandis]